MLTLFFHFFHKAIKDHAVIFVVVVFSIYAISLINLKFYDTCFALLIKDVELTDGSLEKFARKHKTL